MLLNWPMDMPNMSLNLNYWPWLIQCEFFYLKATPEEVENAIEVALQEGYRLIDTAFNYNNEEAIGRALRRWVDAGKCCREELFITTKV